MNLKSLENKLKKAFEPLLLKVVDESHLHAGHAGVAEKGGSHVSLIIVSHKFKGQNRVARQRMVYNVLSDEMANINRKGLHALRMQTYTELEWKEREKQS